MQSEYPFEFVNECALGADVSEADFIWASPPCQQFSGIIPKSVREKYGHLWNHENLIPPIREKLALSGKPYVIENVQGACSELRNPVMICGTMFEGLKVFRHRLFENNFGLQIDLKCNHANKSLGFRSSSIRATSKPAIRPLDDSVEHVEIHIKPGGWERECTTRSNGKSAGTSDTYYFSLDGAKFRSIPEIERCLGRKVTIFEANEPPKESHIYNREPRVHAATDDMQMYPVYGSPGSQRGTVEEWADAMQIDWIRSGKTLAQPIPPAYSEYIGRKALEKLGYLLDYPPFFQPPAGAT